MTLAHPSEQTLAAYGLGKLDDTAATGVQTHLAGCDACKRRVAELSADSFVGKFQEGRGASATGGGYTGLSAAVRAMPQRVGPDDVPSELLALTQYADIRELGRGGMGVVYVAKNTDMDRREVLKVVQRSSLEKVGAGAVERFLREIQAAARLQHPNVVTAYTVYRPGNLLVFAMEYAPGHDLAKVVKAKGPLAVPVACSYVHAAALGLQHAHEAGMVHRDIKPGNLILTKVNGKPAVKVLDFGLAKVTTGDRASTDLTGDGKMMGTPDYMAPEQALDAARADIRADVYALGCTLYYLLAGKSPFGGGTLMQVIDKHRFTEATALNLVQPTVPVELAAAVAKMMAKDPAKRFQTPAEVAKAVRPFISQSAVKPATVPPRPATADTSRPAQTAPVRPTPGPPLTPSEHNPETVVVTVPAAPPSRGRLWAWLLVGLLLNLSGGAMVYQTVYKVRTPNGTIVVENVPDGAEVLVDDELAVTVTRNGESVTVSAVKGGPHRLRVVRDGKELLATDEVVVTLGGEPVRVRVPLPEPDKPPPPPSAPKSLTRMASLVGTGWSVDGDELVARAGTTMHRAFFGDPSWADYRLEFEACPETSQTEYWGMVRAHSVSEYYGYVLGAFKGTYMDLCVYRPEWDRLYDRKHNIAAGTWQSVLVEVSKSAIRCHHDGKLYFSVSDKQHQAGRVGLSAFNGVVRFRNVRITAPNGAVLWAGLPALPGRGDLAGVAAESSLVLAPERSVWAGTVVVADSEGRKRAGGRSVTFTERRGDSFKLEFVSGNTARDALSGTINPSGRLTGTESQRLFPAGQPRTDGTLTGEVGQNRLMYDWKFPEGTSGRVMLKRLPDGGSGFDFRGMWACTDRPDGKSCELTVTADAVTSSFQGKGTWTRDGGLIVARYPDGNPKGGIEWLVLDPDDPDRLTGGDGPQFVTWVRKGPRPKPATGGFVPLFNGKDLTGWVVEGSKASNWTVVDGCIHSQSNGLNDRSYLLSDKRYSDYVIKFDLRLLDGSNASAAVALRAVIGERMPGEFNDRHFDHPIINIISNTVRPKYSGTSFWVCSDKKYVLPTATGSLPVLKAGTWHPIEMTVRGGACDLRFEDGTKLDYRLDDTTKSLAGFVPGLKRTLGRVGFETFQGTVQYRNVFIRDLSEASDSVPAEPRDEQVLHRFQSGEAAKGLGPGKTRLTADGLIRSRGGKLWAATWKLSNGGKTLVLQWPEPAAPGGYWVDTYNSDDGVEFHGTNNRNPPDRFVGRLSDPPTDAELADEAKAEQLGDLLRAHTWDYLDDLYPPSGAVQFFIDGTFHAKLPWRYWVVGPTEMRVQYDRNNYDWASGVKYTFNDDLTRFSGEFTDERGRLHHVTGTRKQSAEGPP